MPVSFLDLVPKPPTTVVSIDTRDHGPQEIELSGIPLRALAEIAKRFPAFAKVLDGGIGGILDHPDALAAIIAASLGHPGSREYEAQIGKFPTADIIKIGFAVIRLTFPQQAADPLPPSSGVGNGAADDAQEAISPSQLNS